MATLLHNIQSFFDYNFISGILSLGVMTFLMAFISKRKHLLVTLLSLEGLMLMIFGLLYYNALNFISLQSFLLVFLTLAACEGALGLSLLVGMVRSYGGDHFNSFNFLQC